MLDEGARSRLIDNISDHLKQCTDKQIVRRSVAIFANVDEDFARRIAAKVGVDVVRKVNLFMAIWPDEITKRFDFQEGKNVTSKY